MNPTGTVTFLFTDIEGSTKLAQTQPDAWPEAQQRHQIILRAAVEANRGHVFNIVGDAFCAAFATGPDALRAAVAAQIALHDEPWGDTPIHVRMGIHAGSAEIQEDGDYRGYLALSRVARLMAAAHGGQVLLSGAAEKLVSEQMPPGVGLRDMGERQLKDLAQPEHIYQILIPGLSTDFPPLKTQDTYRHNLPPQLTRFIGREQEIAEITAALTDHRLITLTGSGGTGKTRLALQVAEGARRRYAGGVWLVELAPLTDPSLIPEAIRLALRIGEQAGQPAVETLLAYLRRKEMLLLLDNCEHLLDATAETATRLLAAAPGLTVLATSRESLGVRGEVAWPVPSLTVPDSRRLPAVEELARYEAVQLFVDRAMLVQPHFSLSADNAAAVAQICARLDGIPLAIEMAAARIRTLGAAQIAARLDDRFRLLTGGGRAALPRQQTLRALIDWSYNLLTEPERVLLRRLAVFAGGWTLEAAESVGAISGEDLDVVDALGHLVDKSMVIADEFRAEVRYRLLETTRQYAREALMTASEMTVCRDRHLAYFGTLAARAELHGRRQLEWLTRLGREHDNLNAALEWALETDPQTGLALAVALIDYWDTRGYFGEGRRALEAALAAAPVDPTPTRVRGLIGAMWFAARQSEVERWKTLLEESQAMAEAIDDLPGKVLALNARGILAAHIDDDYDLAERYFEEALALRRLEGDLFEIGRALGMPAMCALHRFDYGRAERLFNESLALFQATGDEREIAGALWNLAEAALARRDYPSTRARIEDSLARYARLEDRHGIATALRTLSRVAHNQGDLDQARTACEQSVSVFRELEDRTCLSITLAALAWPVRAQGDLRLAELLATEAVAVAQAVGDKASESAAQDALGRSLLAQGRTAEAERHFAAGLAVQRAAGDRQHLPSLLEGLAAAMAAAERPAEALNLLADADALRLAINLDRASVEQPDYERFLVALQGRSRAESG